MLAGKADAQQATIYVKKGNPAGNPNGTTWNLAWPELADAFDPAKGAATAGDVIWVSQGIYKPDPTGTDRTKTFRIPSFVGMYGGFNGNEQLFLERAGLYHRTVLSGDLDGVPSNRSTDSYHVVTVQVDTGAGSSVEDVVLDGFTIQYGNANGTGNHRKGGGLLAHREDPLGGPQLRHLTVENCTFTENQAQFGGGVYVFGPRIGANPDEGLIMSLCTFDSNTAQAVPGPLARGGGLYLEDYEEVHVFNTVFRDNVSDNYGGAVWIGAESQACPDEEDFFNCLFHSNEAFRGAAVYLTQAADTIRFRSCTITQNAAANAGGGLFVERLTGGGIPHGHEVLNSIVWGNTAPTGPSITGGIVSDWTNDVVVDHTDIEGGWAWGGSNNIDADPLFEDPAMDIFKLGSGSPCIEVGLNAYIILDLADLDGDMDTSEEVPFDLRLLFPRRMDDPDTPPASDTIDMGCYERTVGLSQ